MKAWDLPRIPPPPPPPEPKMCVACKGMRAECVVPIGESSAPMCWLCAHHVVDHGCEPHEAVTHECECLPHQIYPGRNRPLDMSNYFEVSRADLYKSVSLEHGDVDRTKPRTLEEVLRGSSLSNARREDVMKHATPAQRKVIENGYRGPTIIADESVPPGEIRFRKKRVCHCGICGGEGHYAKTCPLKNRR